MESSTQVLRRLLDERGVKHRDYCDTTSWLDGSHVARADEYEGQLLVERVMTPEQAIDATLGNDGVGRSNDGVAERGTCRMEWSLADNGWADNTCSNCGYVENTDVHVTLDWNFCPKCGARIVEVTDD